LNSLNELRQTIDSLESGIEDNTLDKLQDQLSILEEDYPQNPGVISLIRMLQSLGGYLGSQKDNAHEDALPLLNTIERQLETLIQDPDSGKEQIDQIISESIQRFKSLKRKIGTAPLVTHEEIQNLKAVILAIDWEISDITMTTFDTVTKRLLTRLKAQKIPHAFLRIINSMGRYIASEKASAHKDSIQFLRSVFDNFEQVVKTPAMPFEEKKQLIENDIDAFNNFKRELASLRENGPVSAHRTTAHKTSDHKTPTHKTPTHKTEDEIIQPALSHVKVTKRPAPQAVVPLRVLPSGDKDVAPALAGKEKTLPPPRDIMDDLFSGKESPADELLDAIHLANIQGTDQKRAMNMEEETKDELQKQGIKSFTPRQKHDAPIPEIENRLNEFFNLDISEDSYPAAENENEETLDTFFEDNSDETPAFEGAITRLKRLMENHDRLLDDDCLKTMDKDISTLKPLWQDDPDKTILLDIISWLIKKSRPIPVSDEKTPPPPLEDEDGPPPGFWGRLKSIFFR
jgi:hypothetical protein